MNTPDLQAVLAQLQAGQAGGGNTPAMPNAGLQASIQAELNAQLMAAQTQFEEAVKTAIAESNELQNSDLVTLQLAVGDEASFRRTPEASIEDLVNWLVANGWAPVGIPGVVR